MNTRISSTQCFVRDIPICALRWGRREASVGTAQIDRIGKLRILDVGERTLLLDVKESGQRHGIWLRLVNRVAF